MKTTIHRVIRIERGLILMSIPRREADFLGNTKVCPVVLAAREELLSENVVPECCAGPGQSAGILVRCVRTDT